MEIVECEDFQTICGGGSGGGSAVCVCTYVKIFIHIIYILYIIYMYVYTHTHKEMEYPRHVGLKITQNKLGLGHVSTCEIQNYPVENNLILSDQQKLGSLGPAPLISILTVSFLKKKICVIIFLFTLF